LYFYFSHLVSTQYFQATGAKASSAGGAGKFCQVTMIG